MKPKRRSAIPAPHRTPQTTTLHHAYLDIPTSHGVIQMYAEITHMQILFIYKKYREKLYRIGINPTTF